MRRTGLSLVLILVPVACDDAAGTDYRPGSSAPAMTAYGEASEASEAERAAGLGLTGKIDYACGDGGTAAQVALYGQDEMAALTVPGLLEDPAYLRCAPTRAGPECTDGAIRALINTVEGTATLSGGALGDEMACIRAAPA